MGLVQFKNHSTGEIVEAEFPLPDELVAYTNEEGEEKHAARADFLAQFAQLLPDLPKPQTSVVPTMAVKQQPGSPIATPAPVPKPKRPGDLDEVRMMLEDLGNVVGRVEAAVHGVRDKIQQLGEAHDHLGRVVEGLAMLPGELHRVGELLGQVHGVVSKPQT